MWSRRNIWRFNAWDFLKKWKISIYGFKKTYAYWHRLNFKRENSYWEICSKSVERGREGERKEY